MACKGSPMPVTMPWSRMEPVTLVVVRRLMRSLGCSEKGPRTQLCHGCHLGLSLGRTGTPARSLKKAVSNR
jgi:hypothetical protein